MESIDATDRHLELSDTPSSSLLTIILDTNPVAWSDLSPSLTLRSLITYLQIFINAHLALTPANQVAILASHTDRAEWLFPSPPDRGSRAEKATNGAGNAEDVSEEQKEGKVDAQAANKYRPFSTVEQQIGHSLRKLLDSTPESSLSATAPTHLAGALTTALTFINKQSQLASPTANADSSSGGNSNALGTDNSLHSIMHADGTVSTATSSSLVARVLILSVSGNLSSQYISVMNAIFAAQRRQIPIDVLKLAGDSGFLQQACDATGGIYLDPDVKNGQLKGLGLLQYLMMAYLPDSPARRALVPPGNEAVDFRAACFCHQKVIDFGFVCSVCLSIFCEPPADLLCLTCGTSLTPPANFNVKPVVVPRRKKKKKRVDGVSGTGTPDGSGTPVAAR